MSLRYLDIELCRRRREGEAQGIQGIAIISGRKIQPEKKHGPTRGGKSDDQGTYKGNCADFRAK